MRDLENQEGPTQAEARAASVVCTYDRCWLGCLNWKTVCLDRSSGASLLGGPVLTLNSSFL